MTEGTLAEQIRNRATMTLDVGPFKVRVKRPTMLIVIRSGLAPFFADITGGAAKLDPRLRDRKPKKSPNELEETDEAINRFLGMTMIDPPVHLGEEPCPENALKPEDCGEIFDALLEVIGGKETEAATAHASTFREDGGGEARP